MITIGGVKYRRDAGSKHLIRVVDDADESRVKAPTSAAGAARVPERIRIGSTVYERSQDGHALVRCRRNKTLDLRKQRIMDQVSKMKEMQRKEKRASKSKYCAFYSYMGKCNRKNCPFLHDKSKVAVCRLFLAGMCDIAGCPLSHEIDESRMPVCRHFLQGNCTREKCPYRHIKVDESNCDDPLLLPFPRLKPRQLKSPTSESVKPYQQVDGEVKQVSNKDEETTVVTSSFSLRTRPKFAM
mmetsp:Transcript_24315/g.79367  ORF Transcript_24315/g.79367 Transcript_24315/m.79367 type:complete len:241 (+) Transcript_24315:500-1222(+)